METVGRYQRQIMLPELGIQGQKELEQARVLVIGAGGLGSPVLWYLAAAGIGTLGICDGDHVEESNLNRQILHGHASRGRKKVESAAESLLRLRPDLKLQLFPDRVHAENVSERIAGWDLVLDCTDTLDARMMISDACFHAGMPLVEGGISGWEGIVYPVFNRSGPCYRCLYPDSPPWRGPEPAIGAVCGTVGAWMAQEGLRWLLGFPQNPGRLLRFNGLTGRIQTITWHRREHCPLCGGADEKNG